MRSPSPPTASPRSGSLTVGIVDGHLAAVLVSRRWTPILGAALVVAACALLAVTPRGAITVPIAAVLGAGAGIAMRDRPGIGRRGLAVGFVAACAEAAVVAAFAGRTGAL